MISLLSPFKAAAIITMIRALIKLDGRTQEPVLPSLVLQGLNTYQASSPIYTLSHRLCFDIKGVEGGELLVQDIIILEWVVKYRGEANTVHV